MLLSLKFPDVTQKTLVDVFFQEKHFIAPTVERLASGRERDLSSSKKTPRSHVYRVNLNKVLELKEEWAVVERKYGAFL